MTDGPGSPRRSAGGEGARGASVEDVVLTANTAFYNAFEAGDLDLMAAVWLPEPDPVCIHPGNAAISGYAEMMRAWAMIFANTPYIQFFLTDVQVRVDEDVAYVTCTENVLSSGEGAPEEGFAGGKALATNVFRELLPAGGCGSTMPHRYCRLGADRRRRRERAERVHHRAQRIPCLIRARSEARTWMSVPVLTSDVIEIRGIRGFGRHGVFEHERADGQEFVVDVRLELDTRPAAASDNLADTVNYGVVAEQVHQAIENDPVDLIETLAQRIADLCLADRRVTATAVTIHKPSAPITVPFDDVVLTVQRRAGESS